MPPRQSRQSREDAVLADVQELSRGPVRLLRNNVGALRTDTGRPVAYGLGSSGSRCNRGTSDLIGWVEREITADMVGQTVAVFAAVECKHLAPPTPEQRRFIEQVRAAGGLAGVAHSPQEAAQILGITLEPGMVGARARFYQEINCDRP